MRYEDEAASTETLNMARRKAYTNDVEQLISRFEHLQNETDSQTERIRSLEDQLRRARKEGKHSAKRVVSLSNENKQHRMLISALRGSKTMMLGRLISKPGVVLKQFGPLSVVKATLNGSFRHKNSTKSSVLASSVIATGVKKTPGVGPNRVFVNLQEKFGNDPSKENLLKLLSHHYFEQGNLSVPADIIRENKEILTDLSVSEESLISKIKGQAFLLETDFLLPPVQPNAGYFAERGRIMYCVHSTGDFDSNGYSTRTTGLVSGLASNEQDILVVARPGYPWDSKTSGLPKMDGRLVKVNDDVEFIYTPGPSISTGRLDHYISEAADAFVREATRNRVSVIHSASNYMTALPALIAARRLGVPFVYEVRGLWEITELSRNLSWESSDRFRLAAKFETRVAKEADSVLAITTQIADTLVERGVGAETISVLPNAVDTDLFKPMPPYLDLVNSLRLDEETIVIGYAGSIVDYEGLAVLLESTKILLDRGKNVRLVIVGDGPELDNLKLQAESLSIKEFVRFAGRVPAVDIPKFMSVFDIMPCPRLRLPITELVSPLKPLEIMASGKALILSDLAPSRDLAGETESRALLAEPGNALSLADVIDRLIADESLRAQLGKQARIWSVSERTWNHISKIAVDTYQNVQNKVVTDSGRALSELTVAIIADEFTLTGIRPEVQTIELDPIVWREQFKESSIDVLFVESAWSGNAGIWQGKVGYYDQEAFKDLQNIVEHCRTNGIPTVFWNKEDPVHFNRFETTAAEFDYVFTTDADCITKYEGTEGSHAKAVASLPFYAQPKLQNPLPGNRTYDHSVSYGGSYYGSKYKKRSNALAQLLQASSIEGLTIYDRQHLNPDSPYKFPANLQNYVVGGLTYMEMLNAYKSHPVHINVNSVDNSPTMFSRRVVEIAASGSAVVSGTGRGVTQVLNGVVPVITDSDDAALLVHEWMSNEAARITDSWRSYRSIHRSHTAAHRLSYVFRTAGLVIDAPKLPQFAVFVPELNAGIIRELQSQTASPSMVYYSQSVMGETHTADYVQVLDFEGSRIAARTAGIEWLAEFNNKFSDRTIFEDLLVPLVYGDWSEISITDRNLMEPGLGIATHDASVLGDLRVVSTYKERSRSSMLQLRRPISLKPVVAASAGLRIPPRDSKTVLIAGHDLKFADGIIGELKARGHEVLVDKWAGHNQHDDDISNSLLSRADVVLCEWSLGNAAWYSCNVSVGQRLVVRLHSQEIFTSYLSRTDISRIDNMIFVGQHIADIAIRDFDIPADLVRIVPNYVGIDGLSRNKLDDAEWNIGMVGVVPQGKRLDLALDLLAHLRQHNPKFKLFIKGRRPEEYPWMKDRPDEMKFYDQQYARIEEDILLRGAVVFDPFDHNMGDWYSKIGTVISVSDFESFHLTLADGAASGSLAISLAWDGADQIYPTNWLVSSIETMGNRILKMSADPNRRVGAIQTARAYVEEHFESSAVLSDLCRVILGEVADE